MVTDDLNLNLIDIQTKITDGKEKKLSIVKD